MVRKRRETPRTAVTVAATGIGAIADAASGGPPGIISGAAAGALLVFEGIWERQKRRGERMLRAAFDVPDERFAEVIREKLQHQRTRDALLEAMRAALEAMSDDVMPALGALIREYERDGSEADGFFRGCCRLLQDLSSDEYESLQRLVKEVANRFAEKRYSMVGESEVSIRADYSRSGHDRAAGDHGGLIVGDTISRNVPNCPREHAVRLFYLLTTYGCASSMPPPLGTPRIERNGRFEPLTYKDAKLAIDIRKEVASKLIRVIPIE